MSASDKNYHMKRAPYTGDLPGEEWRDIPGYEGRYQVSSCGRVRNANQSLLALTPTRGSAPDGSKYRCVMLIADDKSRNWLLVHSIVATTFYGQCPAGMECRHLNDRRDDNRLDNLRWGTPIENAEDRERNGRKVQGTHIVQSKMNEEMVAEARRRVASGETRTSVAQSFGLSVTGLSYAVAGTWWKHVPGAVVPKDRNERNAKMTHDQVRDIRSRYDSGEKPASIARDFPQASYENVWQIATRRSWRHLP